MKRLFLFLFLLLFASLCFWLLSLLHSGKSMAGAEGAPAGYSGSPLDGLTCATVGCHQGIPQLDSGIINTNIPASGYIPDSVYTIYIDFRYGDDSLFGFQTSAFSDPHELPGNFIVTDPVRTQTVGPGAKYITHKTAGNKQPSWSFKWKAPDQNLGNVTFYTTLVRGNDTIDDTTYRTFHTIVAATDIHQYNSAGNRIFTWPNPATSEFWIHNPDNEEILIYDVKGRLLPFQIFIEGNRKRVVLFEKCRGVIVIHAPSSRISFKQILN